MLCIKPQAKLVAAAAALDKGYPNQHVYAQLEVTTGALKRKDPSVTPTKDTTPPAKVKNPQELPADPNQVLVKAIEKLTDKWISTAFS